LIESELFGHVKGAFTGAVASRPGKFQVADKGTLFLDEIGELPLNLQVKLLRALQERVVYRVGDSKPEKVDIRIVAATNRKLDAEIAAGRFRQDLYFRLSGSTIWLPPLRDRPREIAIFAQQFLAQASKRMACSPKTLSDDALRLLSMHSWPGNIRELKNLMDYAAAAVETPVVEAWVLEDRLEDPLAEALAPEPAGDATEAPRQGPQAFRPIDEEVRALERARMVAALDKTDGHQRRAAELISMPLRTFQTKAKLFGLSFDPRRKR